MKQHLLTLTEPVPEWLANHAPGKKIDIQEVLKSRILYYPGSGDDGEPLKTFNKTQCVHTFLYVDYRVTRERLDHSLAYDGFFGYHSLERVEVSESDLVPNGWHQHVRLTKEEQCMMERIVKENYVKPYCLLEIFERDADRDESHGSSRFAVIFLCGDGIASYDAIFCNETLNLPAPFALVLEDNQHGGNYDQFGAGGLMEKIALQTGVYPDYLLVHEHTEPWNGYIQIPNITPDPNIYHRLSFNLYQRSR